MIWDDQNLIVNVKDKGLVIVSGCSHAGAVNVLHNARRLTGEQRVGGFIGGCHLTGGLFEPIIEPTVEAFSAADVGRVLPAHCTGWKAVHLLARAMPDSLRSARRRDRRELLRTPKRMLPAALRHRRSRAPFGSTASAVASARAISGRPTGPRERQATTPSGRTSVAPPAERP